MKKTGKNKILIVGILIMFSFSLNLSSGQMDTNHFKRERENKFKDIFAAKAQNDSELRSGEGITPGGDPFEDGKPATGETPIPIDEANWIILVLGLTYGIYRYKLAISMANKTPKKMKI
jgi:hypothetical protein